MVRRPAHVVIPLDPPAVPVMASTGRTAVGGGAVVRGPDADWWAIGPDGRRMRIRVGRPFPIGARWWVLEPTGPGPGRPLLRSSTAAESVPDTTPPRAPVSLPTERPASPLAPVLVPAVVGVALGLAIRPELALLAVIGPSGALIGRFQDSRRRRRDRDRAEAAHGAALAAHRVAAAERAGRRAADARVDAPGGTWSAWRCRRGTECHRSAPASGLVLRLGVSTRGGVHACPVTTRVDHSVRIGIVGPTAVASGLARSLVLQVLAQRDDVELTVEVVRASVDDRSGEPDDALAALDDLARSMHTIAPPTSTLGRVTIAVASHRDHLPRPCDPVVEVRANAAATVHTGDDPPVRIDPDVLDARLARRSLRAVHRRRREDDVIASADRSIDAPSIDSTSAAWVASRRRSGRTLCATLGRCGKGPWIVDLVTDGPHALIGGTTGSGKSGLLRALVLGLACAHAPDDVVMLLVDYKGGSAFDGLGALPHVVGVVTDLDASTTERALQCLAAEVRRREQLLRAAGCTDLFAYRRLSVARRGDAPAPSVVDASDPSRADPGEALPRLVVVVDELAALVEDLPDLVPSLVAIGQRGRSLGIHLVLATQRPSGVVRADLRANTDLRIALRVLDAAESVDLVGTDAAASLPRTEPGAAIVRRVGEPALRVATTAWPDDAVSALAEVFGAAWARVGGAEPRRPWPEPLPASFAARPGSAALLDDPTVATVGTWRPSPGAGCLLIGPADAGLDGGLAALVVDAADADRRLQVVVVDGTGSLAVLAGLGAVRTWVGPGDAEGRWRLVRALVGVLDRRARGSGPGSGPGSGHGSGRDPSGVAAPHPVPDPVPDPVLVVVGGIGSLLAVDDPTDPDGLRALLGRLATEGPALGVGLWGTADREAAVPTAVLAGSAEVLRAGRAATGGRGVRGRAVLQGDGLEVQLAVGPRPGPWPPASLPDGPDTRDDLRIRRLPDLVTPSSLVAMSWPVSPPGPADGGDLVLVVGLDDTDLVPAALRVGPGAPALVLGPPGPARRMVLDVLAVGGARAGLPVVRLTPGRAAVPSGATGVPVLVLLDGADHPADPDGALERLLADPGALVVAAARAPALRGRYGDWTTALRRARCGLLLPPWSEVDGDLLGVTLPRRRRPGAPADLALLVDHGTVRAIRTPAAVEPSSGPDRD